MKNNDYDFPFERKINLMDSRTCKKEYLEKKNPNPYTSTCKKQAMPSIEDVTQAVIDDIGDAFWSKNA